MKGKYIVLSDLSRPERYRFETPLSASLEQDGQNTSTFGGPITGPPEPTIDVFEGDPVHAAEFAKDTRAKCIARAMPVAPIEPMQTVDTESGDEGLGPTWGIEAIQADKSQFRGETARVAVIDSGIRADHAAFQDSALKIVGKDFTGKDSLNDETGHGTHCAATILGRDVSGRRIGVAPRVKNLLVARIFAPGVSTTSAMVVEALEWAATNRANVISMSLSFNFTGLAAELHESGLAVEAATAQALIEFQNNLRLFDSLNAMFSAQENFPDNQGVVIVGAAGNHSHRESHSGEPAYSVPVAAPNNSAGVISVGALRRRKTGLTLAPFSNSGPTLVAPGWGVLSADFGPAGNNGLCFKSGTSMACPHVAGLAALWWDAVSLGGAPVKAQTVISKIRASCSIDPLVTDLPVDDRGAGIPMAPLDGLVSTHIKAFEDVRTVA